MSALSAGTVTLLVRGDHGCRNGTICSAYSPRERCDTLVLPGCCPEESLRLLDNVNARLQALRKTGATGLEPATSGVTGWFTGRDD